LPVTSSGILVVLIKYFNIISQEMHELFMIFLVHDGKQKMYLLSTLLTISTFKFPYNLHDFS
jgi:hypothetical protein